ncbi:MULTISPECIES: hypothetical protein [Sphingomonas]|jgi:hypothetical protein|uniref:Glycosyltransferase RgtA/B/C/D-like domain-containing protein n=1 Tax=Sphingomonas hankookensis TaxID=563996 RepID=A0ABR5YCM6_9SPHN|nr:MULTISPECIES: hypothetical protein [Sphingomonas]KZE14993.1 hypothetical protein AVT10_14140 [Sphingomonas hankookensis]PZT94513.1 MAG: hypothetical protein DI625_07210 [Sphingomonas sp.]RSV25573.1 hypothetical protein CA237_12290 [Sphingomonas sp. ABOLH]WCP72540.1 hypothetical protein PPZ50_02965 [Sphingomonas hankookensis]
MTRSAEQLRWWQTRWFVALMAVLAAVPLLWPDIPPMVDLPGHMGRYRVQQMWDTGQAPWFHDWYNFDWSLIGNLGVDLLVWLLEPLIGLEPAVKLIILTIPALTAVGLLWIAREVHGRIPATALFALPIVYSFPFHFGFANFVLSMALALNAFALWLRLGRQGRLVLRGVVFVPVAGLIWLTHTFGWGTLGVLAASAELIREHDKRRNWFAAAFHAGLHCLVLAPPALLMLLWRSGGHVGGQTADWFNWRAKMQWMTMTLRDRWQLYDLASVAVFYLVLFKGLRDPNIGYSRNLGLSALFLIAVYVLLPRIVFGSAYADMRLVPYLFGISLIALRPKPGLSIRHAGVLAAIGLAIFVGRMAATTYSFWLYDRDYDRELAALDHVPVGARLVTFVGETCYNEWRMTRLQHLPGIALARRQAYANDQWSMAGGQLLTVRYKEARGFSHDPSELVTDVKCPREYWRPIAGALYKFPRDAFDYVWLIRPPQYDRRLEQGLVPLWRSGRSAVFRIDHSVPPPDLTWSDLGNRPFAKPRRHPSRQMAANEPVRKN